MGKFFGWKLRKHQYPTFLKRPISSDNFSRYILFRLHIFLYILAKIYDSSNIFEETSIFEGLRRLFKILKNLFVFSLFSEPEDSSSSVHFQSSLQHWSNLGPSEAESLFVMSHLCTTAPPVRSQAKIANSKPLLFSAKYWKLDPDGAPIAYAWYLNQ